MLLASNIHWSATRETLIEHQPPDASRTRDMLLCLDNVSLGSQNEPYARQGTASAAPWRRWRRSTCARRCRTRRIWISAATPSARRARGTTRLRTSTMSSCRTRGASSTTRRVVWTCQETEVLCQQTPLARSSLQQTFFVATRPLCIVVPLGRQTTLPRLARPPAAQMSATHLLCTSH